MAEKQEVVRPVLGAWYRTRSGKVGQLTSVVEDKGKVGGTIQITDVEHVVVPDVNTLRRVNPPLSPHKTLPGREF